MTMLTPREQASRYIAIMEEKEANWTHHAPEGYRSDWEYKVMSFPETMIAGIILLLGVPFIANMFLQIGFVYHMMFSIFIFLAYVIYRNAEIKKNFKQKLATEMTRAKRLARAHTERRCQEEGINKSVLQQFVDDRVEEYDLLSELIAKDINPTAWSD